MLESKGSIGPKVLCFTFLRCESYHDIAYIIVKHIKMLPIFYLFLWYICFVKGMYNKKLWSIMWKGRKWVPPRKHKQIIILSVSCNWFSLWNHVPKYCWYFSNPDHTIIRSVASELRKSCSMIWIENESHNKNRKIQFLFFTEKKKKFSECCYVYYLM